MSYNTDRRKPLTKKQRPAFLEAHYFTCYYCGGYILDDEFDDEHVIAKELLPPGSDWNDLSNRRPIHRRPCHKLKTAADIKAIAKSNRIRRENGPVETRKKRVKIRTRKSNWPKRPFPKRRAK